MIELRYRLFCKSASIPFLGAGGFTRESAAEAIAAGTVDAVALGKLFISDPDLPRRLKLDRKLTSYDHATFYGGGAKGYTDYPFLEDWPLSDANAEVVKACG